MESHLEAEAEGWVVTAWFRVQSSEDGVGNGLSNVTARFSSESNPLLFYFSFSVVLCDIFYKYTTI